MAVTFALAAASPFMLKYKVTSGGAEAGNLDAAGAATPDLLTDAPDNSLMAALMGTTVAAQAAGRTLAFDRSDLVIELVPRTAAVTWIIDGDTDGSDHLRLTLTASGADALGASLILTARHSLIG